MNVIWSLVLIGLTLGITYGQNISENCEYTCKSVKTENDDNFRIHLDNGIDYFYMKKEKSVIIYNKEKNMTLIFNGDKKTLSILNNDNGVMLIIDLITNESIIISKETKKIDMSRLQKEDYQVIIEIYQYNLKYLQELTNNNQDKTINLYDILRSIRISKDIKTWEIYESHKEQLDQFESFRDMIDSLNILFQNPKYKVEYGITNLVLYISNYNKTEDILLKNIIKVIMYQTKTTKGDHMDIFFQELRQLIISNKNITVLQKKFEMLNWVILGLNFTYFDIDDAWKDYLNDNVVLTNLTTITDKKNQTYLVYTSMRDGVWHLRVQFDLYNQYNFIQITGNYNQKHLVIWDSSHDLALVFPEGENFGFFNRDTGMALIFNGKTNKAVIIPEDKEIEDTFKQGKIPEAFAIMTKRVLDANKAENVIDGNKLLLAIKNEQDLSSIITDQQVLKKFQEQFSYLIKNLKKIEYTEEFGVVNLVGFMLINTRSEFFQTGFVQLMHIMYKKDIVRKESFMIMYGGISKNRDDGFKQTLFTNIYELIKLVQNNNDPDEIINFLLTYMKLEYRYDCISKEFLARGAKLK